MGLGGLAMAGWDRFGEDKKYRKDVDINDNPKHLSLGLVMGLMGLKGLGLSFSIIDL